MCICVGFIFLSSLSLILLYYYCLWAMLPDSKWMNEWMNEWINMWRTGTVAWYRSRAYWYWYTGAETAGLYYVTAMKNGSADVAQCRARRPATAADVPVTRRRTAQWVDTAWARWAECCVDFGRGKSRLVTAGITGRQTASSTRYVVLFWKPMWIRSDQIFWTTKYNLICPNKKKQTRRTQSYF